MIRSRRTRSATFSLLFALNTTLNNECLSKCSIKLQRDEITLPSHLQSHQFPLS
ncbi:hypothetical protein KSS87_012695 [Heliosperma pusillum]|nr:hypothetical protein KSS87_012695 [Heliosperma pusillum]